MNDLPATERADSETASIDALDETALVRTLIAGNRRALDAADAAAPAIAHAVEAYVTALRGGGRVVAIGAGTSGRLAVLDAAELPPTFGIDPRLVEGRIAGGDAALRRAVEGAEDDVGAGAASVHDLAAGDLLIGISASGGAPFVRAAIRAARARGVMTVALVNAPSSALAGEAAIAIVVDTGAEPIAGSTRMRAGTAQKIVLNAISTAAMIRLGKTYGNRMVDLVATNAKLRARAIRLVAELTNDADPSLLLERAGGRVKTAVVMARRGVTRERAEALLAERNGRLGAVIDEV